MKRRSFLAAIPVIAFLSKSGLSYKKVVHPVSYMPIPDNSIAGACERIRIEATKLAEENYSFELKRKRGCLDMLV